MSDNSREPEFELKRLAVRTVPAAIKKALRYRDLNEPAEAESICRDVLRVKPTHHEAKVTLLLALTDQFLTKGLGGRVEEAEALAEGFTKKYERAYYLGIICERRAKARHRNKSPGCGFAAYHWLRQAMGWYEKAEEMRPKDEDDALLRWNACARNIMANCDIQPAPEETEPPLMLE